jgi:hypothetical protein
LSWVQDSTSVLSEDVRHTAWLVHGIYALVLDEKVMNDTRYTVATKMIINVK